MTRTSALFGVIALAFGMAEVVRPTHFVTKKMAFRALLIRSQAVPGGAMNSLDPALLDDLPRSHPDANGRVAAIRRGDGSLLLTGTLSDPSDGSAGSAVFLELDGSRTSGPAIGYGVAPQPRAFSIVVAPALLEGPGSHRLFVALISADRRGFFLLPDPITVRVGR